MYVTLCQKFIASKTLQTFKFRLNCIDFLIAKVCHKVLGFQLGIPGTENFQRFLYCSFCFTLGYKSSNHCILNIGFNHKEEQWELMVLYVASRSMISSPYLLIMGVWPVNLFPCVADARQVLVLFQLCGLFAFGVLSWSTTQESLVSITCLLANFEVSFFFCLNLWRRGSIPRWSWRLGAPPFLANPFWGIALDSLSGGLDVTSESHCTHPSGGLLIHLVKKKDGILK